MSGLFYTKLNKKYELSTGIHLIDRPFRELGIKKIIGGDLPGFYAVSVVGNADSVILRWKGNDVASLTPDASYDDAQVFWVPFTELWDQFSITLSSDAIVNFLFYQPVVDIAGYDILTRQVYSYDVNGSIEILMPDNIASWEAVYFFANTTTGITLYAVDSNEEILNRFVITATTWGFLSPVFLNHKIRIEGIGTIDIDIPVIL